jgi:hypothetical protein
MDLIDTLLHSRDDAARIRSRPAKDQGFASQWLTEAGRFRPSQRPRNTILHENLARVLYATYRERLMSTGRTSGEAAMRARRFMLCRCDRPLRVRLANAAASFNPRKIVGTITLR